MARKYSNKRMSKIEPSELTLTFATPSVVGGASETFYIDLSQVASIVNRRFYRQGINWAVGGFKFLTPSGFSGQLSVSKLPNTWVMSNAWEKTFRAWSRQQRESLDDGVQESVRAKFNDFKIFADPLHLSKGIAANLIPVSTGDHVVAGAALLGEWEASQLVIPNFGAPGVNYEPFLTAVGAKVGGAGGSYPLTSLYADSRSTPQSPDPAVPGDVLSTDNILNLMFDVGDNNTDVLANVVGKNDELPYSQDIYPGQPTNLEGLAIHSIENVSATTIGGTTRIKGGNFPCGLISIDATNTGSTANITIQIDLVPGNHRGYLCEPMTEM